MAKKKGLTAAYESLPKLLKIVLQLIFGGIIGGIYRIVRFTETNNIVTLVVGLFCTFTGVGNAIAWVVDLVTEAMYDRITVFSD